MKGNKYLYIDIHEYVSISIEREGDRDQKTTTHFV